MVVASCGWLKDNINNSNKNRNINDAIDIVRNTKILAFLLQNKSRAKERTKRAKMTFISWVLS